jgi:hypothetical protein
MMKRVMRFFVFALVLTMPLWAMAEPPEGVGSPHTIPIDADKLDGYHAADFIAMISDLQEVIAGLQERITDLESQVTSLSPLEDLTDFIHVDYGTRDGLIGPHVIFHDANVHVQNGTDDPYSINGLGNLVVGYNGCYRGCDPVNRGGSHNLIVGISHEYTNHNSFVTGFINKAHGPFSSISGGVRNTASGPNASVSGGLINISSGEYSSICGGIYNTASGDYSSVSGGRDNTASGNSASVSGGKENIASGQGASVSGGIFNEASETQSSVNGGQGNLASGHTSSISGGGWNIASGGASSVSGGYNQFPEGRYDWAAGDIKSTAFLFEISQELGDVVISSGANMTIQSTGTFDMGGALIQLNGPGQPAARVGDLVPNAPGPITTGSPTVLIGGGP